MVEMQALKDRHEVNLKNLRAQLTEQHEKQSEELHEKYAEKISMLSSMNDETSSAQQTRITQDLAELVEVILDEADEVPGQPTKEEL